MAALTREQIIDSFERCNSCNVICKGCAFENVGDEFDLTDSESCVTILNRAVYELIMNMLEENESLKKQLKEKE